NKKMNVRLAAQTISSSVADVIDFLRHSGNKDFQGSEATCEFLRIFDRLFDMMNARNSFGKNYKAPVRKENLKLFKEIFDSSVSYISSLKVNDVPVLRCNRKTFALGFILDASSFVYLANDLFSMPTYSLHYFLPYKCSQNNLELYFSCIRNQGSWNDNPNCLQFKWALRKLLFKNKICASVNANCIIDTSNLPAIFKFQNQKHVSNVKKNTEDIKQLNDLTEMLDNIELSMFVQNILHYIGGYVVHKLASQITCMHCINMILA
ncbi:THAP domain-containing protein 9, partial [Harpegnathos saltator]